jgi:hypothetical protein
VRWVCLGRRIHCEPRLRVELVISERVCDDCLDQSRFLFGSAEEYFDLVEGMRINTNVGEHQPSGTSHDQMSPQGPATVRPGPKADRHSAATSVGELEAGAFTIDADSSSDRTTQVASK